MKTRNDIWMVMLFLLNTLVVASVFGERALYGHEYIIFGFLLLAPGLALDFLLQIEDFITRIFIIVMLSVAIDVVVAELILYLGLWSPELILIILVLFCLLLLLFELFSKGRNLTL